MAELNRTQILSSDPDRLEARIRQMLAAGRLAAVPPLLRVLHGMGADGTILAELDARLAMASGDGRAAVATLSRAIAARPGVAALHACRAQALVQLDETADALHDAAEAVLLSPFTPEPKALLGIVLIEAGRPEEAVRCLAEAVEADPAASAYRIAFAEALHRVGRPKDAVFVLTDGVRLLPGDLALRRSASLAAVRAKLFADAVEIGHAARADGVFDAAVLGLTGHALGGLGRHAEAFAAYAEAARLDPGDPYVRHLAAAGGTLAPGPCAPADYVRVVFDGYAGRFDSHLLSLGYRVPGLLRAALEAIDCHGPVTDIGCGTGLLAVACDDLAGPWTGVDLSAGMLEQAGARNLYAVLVQGGITDVLPGLPPAGLVLAGDVLCYFGALDGIFPVMRAHLTEGGHAVFSVEESLDGQDVAIGAQGRFCHGEAHVRAAATAAGFTVAGLQRDVLRWEGGDPVPGLIVTLIATVGVSA